MASKIRFTREDFNELCKDQFYGTKEYPKYIVKTESGNKKVAVWNSSENILEFSTNSKSIINWLKTNSFIKEGTLVEGIISTQQILGYEKPKMVDIIKEKIEKIDGLEVVKVAYHEGSPSFTVVLKKSLDDSYVRDNMFGRTMVISKIHQYKTDVYNELQGELNLLTVNLLSYKFNPSKKEVEFGLNIIGSFTPIR